MWPGFWFCVVAVKGPLEIMAANYGDYDTSLVINCTQGVPLSRPTDLGCLFNERCFDLQFWTTYLTMNNVDKMTLSKNVNWDLCSRWENATQKGPLAALEKQLSFLKWWGPSGLAKNYCWPVFIVAQLCVVVWSWWHLGIAVRGKDDKRVRVMSPLPCGRED